MTGVQQNVDSDARGRAFVHHAYVVVRQRSGEVLRAERRLAHLPHSLVRLEGLHKVKAGGG